MTPQQIAYMQEAIGLSHQGMDLNEGGPFGCVIIRNGEIVGSGYNKVTSSNDPTAHAEVVAIRDASTRLNTFELLDCELYTSCEPCPMCLGAIYWSRIRNIYYACSRTDAAQIGFDDDFIYKEIPKELHQRQIPIVQLMRDEALLVFKDWTLKVDKKDY